MRDKLKALLRLQHFADGTGADGSGVNGTDAGSQNGVTADVAGQQQGANVMQDATVSTTNEDGTVEQTPDRQTAYNELLKEYKDLDDARISNIVRQRLAKPQKAAEAYKKLSPALDMLGKKYGVNPQDAEALVKAIQDDESYYEEEAMERGITVEELKQIRGLERRNAELERQMKEMESRQNADRLYQQWMRQAEEVKQIYPSFDLEAELQNEQFLSLLSNPNVSVRAAYEVTHSNEIIPNAMQFAARTMEQKVANSVKANGARPTENGMSSQAAAATKRDVASLTDAEIADYIRRSQQGEQIRF